MSASIHKLVFDMEKTELKEILDGFKEQLRLEIRHQEALNAGTFQQINTRFDSQNLVIAKLGDTLTDASSKNLDAMVTSQKMMAEATSQMLGKNEQSLQRLHNRIDNIDKQLGEGSKIFAEFGQRITQLERIVYSGGSLLAAGLATLFFQTFRH